MKTVFPSKEGIAMPILVSDLSGGRMGGSLLALLREMKRRFDRLPPHR
jgi:hypothetical protein